VVSSKEEKDFGQIEANENLQQTYERVMLGADKARRRISRQLVDELDHFLKRFFPFRQQGEDQYPGMEHFRIFLVE